MRMKILRIGTPNPTIRFECPVCNSILECNFNETRDMEGYGRVFHCPVCGVKRIAPTYSIIAIRREEE